MPRHEQEELQDALEVPKRCIVTPLMLMCPIHALTHPIEEKIENVTCNMYYNVIHIL